ncbi:50S ribosomal protein L1 [candidate division WOR-1 bacterium RIFOXYA12_FULL_52_29]|uniref:Large ribosomal subunit protein uL1 n=1 Tax=candidate division WOR-1 bacterium RIFOXYC12_FULL_54_18 TaxID=1802584 RepID=A0A1F4T608_UNCSA|nr:MAG: 50S ribosomal protein L1 [candidate division WOR-1 bacterium RIFOXYA2_FULL_51_19]OGC17599.1 MAG: 50S ribosomal protein L1 [candidate division WOR-1 bacterium RIFOXYA12_FULL_52_29]OGC26456.1 MAG: 50S ribosomal protein L1 [candidate division WOR-1 bacterium RIFOXYB2_FULL_45_9]OGC28016.1 MAG: 50S ribosomal protein L1 [candidate division WOR-1 bacterium RIFOXYC12_FULL_54_18]OGC29698.1 MAG: 50S ribosomal protein L1 [candidate division WOR-1 bacterium RIFOXYB12_FULL_52_16]
MSGKKFNEKNKLINHDKKYTLQEGIALLKQTAWAKFDETVDLAIKLGVNTTKNPSIRGAVSLPSGSGKSKKIAVITSAAGVKEAEKAGAAVAGSEDLVEKIKNGFLDFDILIASPDMMGSVGKLGKMLGPKGLMPNPKTGTVTEDVAKAVAEFKGGKVEFKMDKGGAVHMVIGKVSFAPEALARNFKTALEAISRQKPSGLKGVYIRSITLSSTMGPGIKLDTRKTLEEVE